MEIRAAEKALKRLRLHLPNCADGYLYLLLREFNFDPTECLIHTREKALPEWLELLPSNFTMEEAREFLTLNRSELARVAHDEAVRYSAESEDDIADAENRTPIWATVKKGAKIPSRRATTENIPPCKPQETKTKAHRFVTLESGAEESGEEHNSPANASASHSTSYSSRGNFVDDEAEDDSAAIDTESETPLPVAQPRTRESVISNPDDLISHDDNEYDSEDSFIAPDDDSGNRSSSSRDGGREARENDSGVVQSSGEDYSVRRRISRSSSGREDREFSDNESDKERTVPNNTCVDLNNPSSIGSKSNKTSSGTDTNNSSISSAERVTRRRIRRYVDSASDEGDDDRDYGGGAAQIALCKSSSKERPVEPHSGCSFLSAVQQHEATRVPHSTPPPAAVFMPSGAEDGSLASSSGKGSSFESAPSHAADVTAGKLAAPVKFAGFSSSRNVPAKGDPPVRFAGDEATLDPLEDFSPSDSAHSEVSSAPSESPAALRGSPRDYDRRIAQSKATDTNPAAASAGSLNSHPSKSLVINLASPEPRSPDSRSHLAVKQLTESAKAEIKPTVQRSHRPATDKPTMKGFIRPPHMPADESLPQLTDTMLEKLRNGSNTCRSQRQVQNLGQLAPPRSFADVMASKQRVSINYPEVSPTEDNNADDDLGGDTASSTGAQAEGEHCYYATMDYWQEKYVNVDNELLWPSDMQSESSHPTSDSHFMFRKATGKWTRPGYCPQPSRFTPDTPFELSRSVFERLYPYQKEAVAWMFELFKHETGGILGDEMGLGKTVQASAFLRGLFASRLAATVLLLCPLSLLSQWITHLNTWVGSSHACIVEFRGNKKEREAVWSALQGKTTPLIILTSYETFRNHTSLMIDPPHVSVDLAVTPDADTWDILILDEAHKIKKSTNLVTVAVKSIRAKTRILLTGTPVMNMLTELWSLMDTAAPGVLGPLTTFRNEFSQPIAKGLTKDASDFARRVKDNLTRELFNLISPHFLRRTGTDPPVTLSRQAGTTSGHEADGTDTKQTKLMATLPSKTDLIVWMELTHVQRRLYQVLLDSRETRDLLRQKHRETLGSSSLRVIGRLGKVCKHPILLLPQEQRDAFDFSGAPSAVIDDGDNTPRATRPEYIEEETRFIALVHTLVPHRTPEDLLASSVKLMFLQAALPEMQVRGHKVLLFSQSREVLSLIERCIMQPFGLTYRRVDGSVNSELRTQLLDEYKRGKGIFALLLTTKVGGLGLNLTCADRVIIVDPDWTPANDNQAVARVYRNGQTRPVVILRLFVAGAIEDHAFRLQTIKQGISKAALQNPHQKAYFASEDLRKVFVLTEPGQSTTKDLLAEANADAPKSDANLEPLLRRELGDLAVDTLVSHIVGFSNYDDLYKVLAKAADKVDSPSNS